VSDPGRVPRPVTSTPPASERLSPRAIRPGVFLDRDGTLMRDTGFVKNPDDVQLVPNAANAVRRINFALWPVIVVTNQSGIARGLLTEEDYARVRARLDDLIQERGGYIDAHYHCPHLPEISGPCDCRTPGVALFERAMSEHSINPLTSVFIGDRWRDVAPALHFGARGILVPSEHTPTEDVTNALKELSVVKTLADALSLFLPPIVSASMEA
jgi:D-glycero-D-manno-heptose 1,7-bisphosphate phosphatase